jgi:hypothetical protein
MKVGYIGIPRKVAAVVYIGEEMCGASGCVPVDLADFI